MSTTIKDGTGNGPSAKVDSKNRLRTLSTNVTTVDNAILNGDAFIFNSGLVTLTTDGESGLLYFKNNSDDNLSVNLVNFVQGISTGGTGHGVIQGHINPTGGTLISTATAAINFNTNTSSPKTFDGLAYAGFEGATTTGALGANIIMTEGAGKEVRFDPKAVLPKGGSITWAYTPPSGNTSMVVQILVIVYVVTEDIV